MVRIGGDNSLHVSEIDYFVERRFPPLITLPVPGEEDVATIATVCGKVFADSYRPRHTASRGRVDLREAV